MEASPSDTVLVTGATGYIAGQCVVDLLDAGYRVRGTVRSRRSGEGLSRSLSTHPAVDRLELVTADLSADAGWDDAVAGCRYVLHVASPVLARVPKDPDEIIKPAVEGTRRVVEAAQRWGAERIVMTSSVAAITSGHDRNDRTFSEADWSVVARSDPYATSKTLAERAAWEMTEETATELAVINPGFVLGPAVTGSFSPSCEVVRRLLKRTDPGVPDLSFNTVDVRDIATAHLRAMTTAQAAGNRFLLAGETIWYSEIAGVVAAHVGDRGYRVRTNALPDWMVRIVGRFDASVRMVADGLGRTTRYDITNARKVLGVELRSVDETLTATADSLIEHGEV